MVVVLLQALIVPGFFHAIGPAEVLQTPETKAFDRIMKLRILAVREIQIESSVAF
jgi:hypothetical protein